MEPRGLAFSMPKRIVTRWGKHVRKERKARFQYDIHTAVERANVSADEFKKCWAFVASRLSDGELFNLFKRARFGQRNNTRISDKIQFVKEIKRRFELMGGPVRLSRMPLINVRLCLYIYLYFVILHTVMHTHIASIWRCFSFTGVSMHFFICHCKWGNKT